MERGDKGDTATARGSAAGAVAVARTGGAIVVVTTVPLFYQLVFVAMTPKLNAT